MSTAEAERDRRSRMAYSTVNAAPKKGGAGGAFTWGSAGDASDYVPTTYIQPSIIMAPAVMPPVQPAVPFTANLASSTQFPTLGMQPAVAQAPTAWTTVPASVAQPVAMPTMVPAPAPAAVATETIRSARLSQPQPVLTAQPQPVLTTRVVSQTLVSANTGSLTSSNTGTLVYPSTSFVQQPQQPSFTYAAPVRREVPVDKDRRSRMAYSTVNAAPKKGGAGGAYTWGTAGEMTEYAPTEVMQPKIVTAPAPVATQPAAQSVPFTASLGSQSQFPDLGAPVTAPAPAAAWANRPQPAAVATEVATQPVEAGSSVASQPPSSPVKQQPSASQATESATSSPQKEAKTEKKEEASGSNCSVM